jgi:hypothetical protein
MIVLMGQRQIAFDSREVVEFALFHCAPTRYGVFCGPCTVPSVIVMNQRSGPLSFLTSTTVPTTRPSDYGVT